MPVFRTKEEAYDRCLADGNIISQENVNLDVIKANLRIAEEDLESAKDAISKKRWNSAYKLHYDALHGLVEAYLLFDKIKTFNHQCLFSSICVKYPELELSWEFFEKIRTKRNGINYYGTPVLEKDWKEVELLFKLYHSLLKKEVENRLK
jgi:uncharacterized protein (UPF0332 family)